MSGHRPVEPDRAAVERRCLVALWLLAAGMGLVGLVHAAQPAAGDERPAAIHAIDPNSAPWWELTALPRFGPALAFAVVRHRESAGGSGPGGPVFRCAADLEQVRGIGPRTVERAAPYLRFDGR